jgi:hypothetical protein
MAYHDAHSLFLPSHELITSEVLASQLALLISRAGRRQGTGLAASFRLRFWQRWITTISLCLYNWNLVAIKEVHGSVDDWVPVKIIW